MKRLTKKKYMLFAAISAIVAVMAVNLHSIIRGGNLDEEILEEEPAPVPLNHLMDNSMSDLKETGKFDAAIRRFMHYWGIKGGSFALMKNAYGCGSLSCAILLKAFFILYFFKKPIAFINFLC